MTEIELRINAMAQEDTQIIAVLTERCRMLAVANALANEQVKSLRAKLAEEKLAAAPLKAVE